MPTLGQRLRALRVERGLSQAELAGDLVSPSYVSLIESDRRSPERAVLDGLASRLGCSPFYLESGVAPEELTEQKLRLQFAEIALANGDVAEARARFGELAGAASTDIKNSAVWGLARADEAAGDLHAALNHLDALLGPSRSAEQGAPGLLSLLIGRCRLYNRAGDYAHSISVGEEALREVRELGLAGSEDEIKLASTLVFSYWGRGDLFSAQHLAEQVIEQAEKLGSRTAQGSAYWNASAVAEARGQLTLALDLAAKTLALLSESSSSLGKSLAGMRVSYAWLLLRCDPPRLDEADALLAHAHDVLSSLSFEPHLASCETEMARSALLHGRCAAAASLAEQAIRRCEGTGAAEIDNARVVRGLALLMDGQTEEGESAVADAATRLEQRGSRIEAAHAWRDLAEALIHCGEPGKAIPALRRAADCAGARASSVRTIAARVPSRA
jgi:transcriptional regulator with XRE-family HTH domain